MSPYQWAPVWQVALEVPVVRFVAGGDRIASLQVCGRFRWRCQWSFIRQMALEVLVVKSVAGGARGASGQVYGRWR